MHWMIHQDEALLDNWLAAFPEAQGVTRSQISTVDAAPGDVFWYRHRASDAVSDLATLPVLRSGGILVVLADMPDEALIASALSLGAQGCCNTHADPEVLQRVALVVSHGGLWVGRTMLDRVIQATHSVVLPAATQAAAPLPDWRSLLSPREVEVAETVASGLNNREASLTLGISERTVKSHLTLIFEKLDVRDRLQLSLRIKGLNI